MGYAVIVGALLTWGLAGNLSFARTCVGSSHQCDDSQKVQGLAMNDSVQIAKNLGDKYAAISYYGSETVDIYKCNSDIVEAKTEISSGVFGSKTCFLRYAMQRRKNYTSPEFCRLVKKIDYNCN